MTALSTSRIVLLGACLPLAACKVVETHGETRAESSGGVAAAAPTARSGDSLAARIDSVVRAHVAADSFSGAVIVARDGAVVYSNAAGLADRSTRAPNRLDTKFNLGSVDKYFTRIAVRQLQRDGRLSMADTLGKFVPDYPNARARSVTVEQLYQMRAGIPDIFNERWDTARHGLRTTDDFVRLFADRPLLFEPGTRQEYCNGCYVLLGKIVEVASGQSWYDYAREHVFAPAGMTGTGYFERDARTANRAVGYTTEGADGPAAPAGRDGRRPNTFTLGIHGGSAGGGYSTAEDLLRLDGAVRSGRLLGAAYTDSLLGPAFRKPVPEPGRPGRSGWIGGSAGVNAVFAIRSSGYTVIVLSNYDPPSAESLGDGILRLVGEGLR